jgi:Rrf2 family nitric oxide-sensitive transcriptional repressor
VRQEGRGLFSSTAEYALRAAAYLAQNPDRLSSSQIIADATKVPHGYLSKVLNDLVTAGVVESRRGPSGGFVLKRPADKVSVLDVVNAVDPIQRIRECPLGLKAHKHRLCTLHRRMDEAIAMVEQILARSTMAEMIADGGDQIFPLERRPIMPTLSGRPKRR